MARSLKGMKFFVDSNNGVTALVSEEVLRNYEKRRGIERAIKASAGDVLAHIPDTPIFTFSNPDRVSRSPWFMGTINMFNFLCRFINNQGGITEGGGAFTYVPFSNQKELGVRGREKQLNELRSGKTAWLVESEKNDVTLPIGKVTSFFYFFFLYFSPRQLFLFYLTSRYSVKLGKVRKYLYLPKS